MPNKPRSRHILYDRWIKVNNCLLFLIIYIHRPTSRVSRTINTRTYRYDGSGILLRQGRRAIKAISVLSTGRSSSIITREFVVQWAPSESDEEEEESKCYLIHSNAVLAKFLESHSRLFIFIKKKLLGIRYLFIRADFNQIN